MPTIEEQLELHEGRSLSPYKDSVGIWTVGIGRNLKSSVWSNEEVDLMLQTDIRRVVKQAHLNFRWFTDLSHVRKKVIIDMIFNLGLQGFKSFKKTIGYIEHKRYDKAAIEMLNSVWADQVGVRALRLSSMMKLDEDYTK